jgi:uncharacterized protein (TIGR02453 family)
VAPEFTGVPKQTLAFLRGLDAHNDKTWFEAHRAEYERDYLGAGIALVQALGPRLEALAPGLQYEPRVNGSLFRVHRDVRFSKDKTPYKAHLDLWFWEGGRKGWDAPGFFFRLAPKQLVLGVGMHRFEAAQLERYRQAVLDPRAGKALAECVAKVAQKPYRLGEASRKSVPRGLPADHPRAELLKHDGLTGMLDTRLPPALHTTGFVDDCVDHYRRLLPVHQWLMRHVVR